jgi:hypothetical protein
LGSKSGFTEAIFFLPSAVKLVSPWPKLLPSKHSIVVIVAHVMTAKEDHAHKAPHAVGVDHAVVKVNLDHAHKAPHAVADSVVVSLDHVHQVHHVVADSVVVSLDHVHHANPAHHKLVDREVMLDHVHHANPAHHKLVDHEVMLDHVHHANPAHRASSLSIRDLRAAKILPLQR